MYVTFLLQTVKTIDSSENSTKAIDSWIKNIADLHRTQPAPTVHYSKYVTQTPAALTNEAGN